MRMVSQASGYKTLLEISNRDLIVTVKTKKSNGNAIVGENDGSSIFVDQADVNIVTFGAAEDSVESPRGSLRFEKKTVPLFFEQTDYLFTVEAKDTDRQVSVDHEIKSVRESIEPISDGHIAHGTVNFGNNIGYSDFTILLDNIPALSFTVEVFPTKMSYREDYRLMTEEINEMATGAIISYLRKTYKKEFLSIGGKQIPIIFYEILKKVFSEYVAACQRVLSLPNHKLEKHYSVEPVRKAKSADRRCEKWLMTHTGQVAFSEGHISANKVMTVQKVVIYDTNENRFVKYILQSTIRRIKDFICRFQKNNSEDFNGHPNTEILEDKELVINNCNRMIERLKRFLSTSFFEQVSDYSSTQSMSLVFGMAPGYRELYKYYNMLRMGLSVHGDIFNLAVKDTAQLYEYWCFIKLYSILKNTYNIDSGSDIIKVDSTGVTVNLYKNKNSKVVFVKPETDERIVLSYNESFGDSITTENKPDNVLSIEKLSAHNQHKYVFDAKYRLACFPTGPDSKGEYSYSYYPKADDINAMHRYRDAIVYSSADKNLTFEKQMYGAYILFPYPGTEEEYRNNKFYQSIEKVNIGGFPFLPGKTYLAEKQIRKLVNIPAEVSYRTASFPAGTKEKLKTANWADRNVAIVMIDGKAIEYCLSNSLLYHYKKINESIEYIALYNSNKGVFCYGKLIKTEQLTRAELPDQKHLPASSKPSTTNCYAYSVKRWIMFEKPNREKKFMTPLGFFYTNRFLLENAKDMHELLIKSEEGYLLYSELKRIIENKKSASSFEVDEKTESEDFIYNGYRFVFEWGQLNIYSPTSEKIMAVSLNKLRRNLGQQTRLIKKLLETT